MRIYIIVPRSCFPCFIVGETLAATSGPLLECKEYGPSDLIPIRQSAANLLKRGPKPHLEDEMKMKGLLRGCCHQKKRCMDIVLAVILGISVGLFSHEACTDEGQ